MKVDSLFGRGPDILKRLKIGLDDGLGRHRAAVLIDCCPMLGVLSLSGVFASDRVLVPISTDFLAVRGALALDNTLKALEHVLKRRVERRYVLTRFDSRRMSHDIAGQLRERFGAELCETRIAESVALAESPCPPQGHLRPRREEPRGARLRTASGYIAHFLPASASSRRVITMFSSTSPWRVRMW